MGRKFVFILKILVGSYLIFVGVTLLQTTLDIRPSNFQIMSVTSALFILVGIGYVLGLLVSTLKKKMNGYDLKYMEEPARTMTGRPVHDGAIYRTAPMTTLQEEKQAPISQRPPYQEEKVGEQSQRRASVQSTATVQLQTVGPDTMVWKNDGTE